MYPKYLYVWFKFCFIQNWKNGQISAQLQQLFSFLNLINILSLMSVEDAYCEIRAFFFFLTTTVPLCQSQVLMLLFHLIWILPSGMKKQKKRTVHRCRTHGGNESGQINCAVVFRAISCWIYALQMDKWQKKFDV